MTRLLAYILVLVSFLVLMAGSSPAIMSAIDKWVPSPYTHGDLYMFSNLRQFKDKDVLEPCVFESRHLKMSDINVFAFGDSYMLRLPRPSFNVNSYTFTHWEETACKIPALDTQKKNILLIESSERYFRQRLQNPANDMLQVEKGYVAPPKEKEDAPPLFNLKAEDDLTYLLTYNNVACYLKEIKAWLNLHLFKTVDKNITLAKDEQHIFITETTDSTRNTSSFNNLTDAEVDKIIENLNATYHHYLSMGFSAVYLTIIPNAVSLIKPQDGHYNHLIERVEKSPKLEMPVIDLYNSFIKSPDQYYFSSDTHWNCRGSNVWAEKIDSVFYSIEENRSPIIGRVGR